MGHVCEVRVPHLAVCGAPLLGKAHVRPEISLQLPVDSLHALRIRLVRVAVSDEINCEDPESVAGQLSGVFPPVVRITTKTVDEDERGSGILLSGALIANVFGKEANGADAQVSFSPKKMMANMATMAMAMAMAMAMTMTMGLSGIVDYLCVGCTRHQTRDAKSSQYVMARTGKLQLHHDIDCNRDCDCGFVAEFVPRL